MGMEQVGMGMKQTGTGILRGMAGMGLTVEMGAGTETGTSSDVHICLQESATWAPTILDTSLGLPDGNENVRAENMGNWDMDVTGWDWDWDWDWDERDQDWDTAMGCM
jgi:hypothetical protein